MQLTGQFEMPTTIGTVSRPLTMMTMTQDLPRRSNRVEWIDGRLRVTHRRTNVGPHVELTTLARDLMRGAGYEVSVGRLASPDEPVTTDADGPAHFPQVGGGHDTGTLRMGATPSEGVVDADCQLHGVEHLYVVDASVLPSQSSMNPALTIIANALRVARTLGARLGRPEGVARVPPPRASGSDPAAR
jgi:choline dehydrogenase-like flavoprotein